MNKTKLDNFYKNLLKILFCIFVIIFGIINDSVEFFKKIVEKYLRRWGR